ncbi:hypothetical protein STEG23_007072 [Scotinomys teguina]
MNSSKSILGRTLEQLYEAYNSKSNDTAYLMYNDGVPKSTNYSRKYGHTKGLLVWNRTQGFWLIHSVPGFPPFPEDGYDYPSSGKRYGQSGICITFKYSQYEIIDSHLLVSQPNIYSCSIPNIFHQELIHMPQLCAKSSSFKIPGRRLTMLQSAQGLNFLHFVKPDSYTDDILTAWMAQHLKTNLLAETWQRKGHELPSNCSLPYHVYNIKTIKLDARTYLSSYRDHSKWCISTEGSKYRWTCIGDLNRDPHQAFRGGGFICTPNRNIYYSFQSLLGYKEPCNFLTSRWRRAELNGSEVVLLTENPEDNKGKIFLLPTNHSSPFPPPPPVPSKPSPNPPSFPPLKSGSFKNKYVEYYHLDSLQLVYESGMSEMMEMEHTDSHVLGKYFTSELYSNPEPDISGYLFPIYDKRCGVLDSVLKSSPRTPVIQEPAVPRVGSGKKRHSQMSV